MPTSGSGISNVNSKALPGKDDASTWMSFMKASTVPSPTFIHRALRSRTAGNTVSLQRFPLDLEHRVEPVADHNVARPRLDGSQQVFVATQRPSHQPVFGVVDAPDRA